MATRRDAARHMPSDMLALTDTCSLRVWGARLLAMAKAAARRLMSPIERYAIAAFARPAIIISGYDDHIEILTATAFTCPVQRVARNRSVDGIDGEQARRLSRQCPFPILYAD